MQSKQNLELKHFCEDFQKIRVALKKIGATKDAVKKQKDYFLTCLKRRRNKKPA